MTPNDHTHTDSACDLLLDHAYGELEGGRADAFRAHLAGCEPCRSELAAIERVRGAAKEVLTTVEPPASLSGGLHAQLIHAAARRRPTGKVLRFARSFVSHPGWAAAAGLLIVGGAIGLQWSRGRLLMPTPALHQEGPSSESEAAQDTKPAADPSAALPAAEPAPASQETSDTKDQDELAREEQGAAKPGPQTAASELTPELKKLGQLEAPRRRAKGGGGEPLKELLDPLGSGSRDAKSSSMDGVGGFGAAARPAGGLGPSTGRGAGGEPEQKGPAANGAQNRDEQEALALDDQASSSGRRATAEPVSKRKPPPQKSQISNPFEQRQAASPASPPMPIASGERSKGEAPKADSIAAERAAPAAPAASAPQRAKSAKGSAAPADTRAAEDRDQAGADAQAKLRRRAQALAAAGSCQEAIKVYGELDRRYPGTGSAVERLPYVRCLRKTGRLKLAQQQLDALKDNRAAQSRMLAEEQSALELDRRKLAAPAKAKAKKESDAAASEPVEAGKAAY